MKNMKKRMILSTLTIFLMLFTSLLTYPYVVANYTENAYDGGNNKNTRSLPLSTCIVYSAGYLLKSYSDTLIFLNKIEVSELQGIDYDELSEIVSRAIYNMEKTKEYYTLINLQTTNLNYNEDILNCLKNFDYVSFQKEKGLNFSIFENVKNHLIRGDVSGIFKTLLSNSDSILRTLYRIREILSSKNIPRLEELWRVNQNLSETMLFGQYSSEIFKRILSENIK